MRFTLAVVLLILLTPFCLCVTVTADFSSSPNNVSSGSYLNFFRRAYFFGESLHAQDPEYELLFRAIGAEYAEVGITQGDQPGIDDINPSEGIYDYSLLDATLDDVLDQGFIPFVRFFHPPSWIAPDLDSHERKLLTFRDATAKQKFITLTKDIITHIRNSYGTQTYSWYFAATNEVAIYDLSENWYTGSDYWVDFWYDWLTEINSVDSQLQLGGPGEGGSYELKYLLNDYYANKASQDNYGPKLIELLGLSSFVSYHHYGLDVRYTSYTNKQGLNKAGSGCNDLELIRSSLDSKGLSNVKIFETESNFNSDGADLRSQNHIGGMYAVLNVLHNASCGLDARYHWWDYAGPWGLKPWTHEDNPYPSYYALKLLYEQIDPDNGYTVYYSSPMNNDFDIFALVVNGKETLVVFNKNDYGEQADFVVNLPADFDSPQAVIDVYNYSETRQDASATNRQKSYAIDVSSSTISFSENLEKESMLVIRISEYLVNHDSCESSGFYWTGSTCCGDEIEEHYSDPGSGNSCCWKSIGQASGIIGAGYYPDDRRFICLDGQWYGRVDDPSSWYWVDFIDNGFVESDGLGNKFYADSADSSGPWIKAPSVICPDTKKDGAIDIFDLIVIVKEINSGSSDRICDINDDGSINVSDLQLVADRFNQNCVI